MSLAGFIYTLFFVRETHYVKPQERVRMITVEEIDTDRHLGPQPSITPNTTRIDFCQYLPIYLLGSLRVLAMRRRGWIRFCLCLTMLSLFVEYSFDTGLVYLALKRPPFDWDDTAYSRFVTAKILMGAVGTVTSPVLVGWLCGGRVVGSESLLLVAGIGGYAGASAIMALAKTNTHVLMSESVWGGGDDP